METIDVSVGLIFRDGKLLITQRFADAHLGGLWEFPGGKRHPDESFEECLARELREELGIEVDLGPLLAAMTHAYPEKKVHLRFFQCFWLKNEPAALGCADFKWVTAKEIGDYDFPAADARILKHLQALPHLWRRESALQ